MPSTVTSFWAYCSIIYLPDAFKRDDAPWLPSLHVVTVFSLSIVKNEIFPSFSVTAFSVKIILLNSEVTFLHSLIVFGLHSNEYTVAFLNFFANCILSSPYLDPNSKIYLISLPIIILAIEKKLLRVS